MEMEKVGIEITVPKMLGMTTIHKQELESMMSRLFEALLEGDITVCGEHLPGLVETLKKELIAERKLNPFDDLEA